jgi:hypothetical protein
MKCANPDCAAQTLYLRSGGIFAVDLPDGAAPADESQIMQRRVIWLCAACIGAFSIETWRPPGQQVRPSRSFPVAFPRSKRRITPPEAAS